MKKLLFLIACICLEAQAQIPSTLGWYEVPNTKLSTVCPSGLYPQCKNVIVAWGGGAFDTKRNRALIWGGGHNDYSGNEVYAVNFSGVPSVERITNPTVGGCSLPSCDGGVTPNARHTYDTTVYVPGLDVLAAFGGAMSNSGYGAGDAWQLDLAHPSAYGQATWHNMGPTASGQLPVAVITGSAVGYDPTVNRVILTDGRSFFSYDPTANAFTTLRYSENAYTGYYSAVLDSFRNKFYVLVNYPNSDIWSLDLTTNTGVYKNPTGITSIIQALYGGIVYDPVSHDVLFWNGGNTVYDWNPDTNVISAISQYAGGPGAASVNGTFDRFNYSPALDAFTLINDFDQNAFVFRTRGSAPPPSDTTAPSIPSSLTGTTMSTAQINLSWAASTDNVGVTGYRLERCSGSGCSSFAQISTPTASPYSDSGLTASTSYSYRVRATDAAGNLSAYSSVADAGTASTPPIPPSSSTITVGPGKMYSTICAAITAAQAGNIIEVDSAVYQDESCNVTKALTLKGIGGYAHMRWGTGDYSTNTATIPNGKGTLIIQATTTVDDFEFSGAKVADENGAGIRYESGDLTITNSYFHGNQNGLLGQGGLSNTLLIEHSRFDRNGFCGGGGCGHNLYVGLMGKLIFHDNVSTNSLDGSHTLKSRAQVNEITDSFLSTRDSDGSLEADFPNGGTVIFSGNTVEQGPNTSNSTMLGYGLEGATNPNKRLVLSLNKFINRRTNGATFVQVNGSPAVDYKTNTFIGSGTVPSNLNTTNTVAP